MAHSGQGPASDFSYFPWPPSEDLYEHQSGVEQFEWRQRAVRDAFGKAVLIIWSTLTFVVRCQRLNSDSHEIGISYRHGDPHGFNAWKLLMIGLED